jgi:hypothetical protein
MRNEGNSLIANDLEDLELPVALCRVVREKMGSSGCVVERPEREDCGKCRA